MCIGAQVIAPLSWFGHLGPEVVPDHMFPMDWVLM